MPVSELADFSILAVSIVLADTVDCSGRKEEELVCTGRSVTWCKVEEKRMTAGCTSLDIQNRFCWHLGQMGYEMLARRMNTSYLMIVWYWLKWRSLLIHSGLVYGVIPQGITKSKKNSEQDRLAGSRESQETLINARGGRAADQNHKYTLTIWQL
jgi:hypothetical protein